MADLDHTLASVQVKVENALQKMRGGVSVGTDMNGHGQVFSGSLPDGGSIVVDVEANGKVDFLRVIKPGIGTLNEFGRQVAPDAKAEAQFGKAALDAVHNHFVTNGDLQKLETKAVETFGPPAMRTAKANGPDGQGR
jgi:hypothetical protein